MSKIHLRFAAEAVNKDAGAPQTFVLEQIDASSDDNAEFPYTSSFDVGDTDYGRGLKVYSRMTVMTDGTREQVAAAFGDHLDLFVELNLKHAERLGKLRDDAKSGMLWLRAAAQQSASPPPPPPPPMTSTPQTNPPGARLPPASRQLTLPTPTPETAGAKAPAGKSRRPTALT